MYSNDFEDFCLSALESKTIKAQYSHMLNRKSLSSGHRLFCFTIHRNSQLLFDQEISRNEFLISLGKHDLS